VCDGSSPALINYYFICVMYDSIFLRSFKAGVMFEKVKSQGRYRDFGACWALKAFDFNY
jgi:hypothetical protein